MRTTIFGNDDDWSDIHPLQAASDASADLLERLCGDTPKPTPTQKRRTTMETVGDLRDALEDYDRNTPLRLTRQPSWPAEHTIDTVVATPDDDTDTDSTSVFDEQRQVVWLVEGEQVGYLPTTVAQQIGWD